MGPMAEGRGAAPFQVRESGDFDFARCRLWGAQHPGWATRGWSLWSPKSQRQDLGQPAFSVITLWDLRYPPQPGAAACAEARAAEPKCTSPRAASVKVYYYSYI